MISASELSDDQRRQLVDARQVFEAWQSADAVRHRRYRGSMRWLTRKGRDYLHRKLGTRERSLGARTVETERAWDAFHEGRARNRLELARLSARLDDMAPVNRALGLGRIPRLTARIVRGLEKQRLLGQHLLLVGTNALFCYESAAGVFFQGGLLATGDADLLWDARQRLALVLPEARSQGVLGVLQRTDRSFQTRGPRDFRAFNGDGFWVDLIRPEDKRFLASTARDTLGEREDDLHGSPIRGLQWLVSAPRFERVAVGADGYPVRLVTVDPRAFALHKLWLSQQAGRDPVKRQRDVAQAVAVAALCRTHLALPFESEALRALPLSLRRLLLDGEQGPVEQGPVEPHW